MTDRYFRLAAPVDPVKAEELRQRLHARLDRNEPVSGGTAGSTEPSPNLIELAEFPVEEYPVNVVNMIPKRRRNLIIGVAAAVVAAAVIIGVVIVAGGDDDVAPSNTVPTTTATVIPTTAALTTVAPTTAATVIPTTATPTTSAPLATPQPLPLVNVPEGTYRVDQFAVAFDITTEGEWRRVRNRSELFGLGRGTNQSSEFLVSSGLISGATAAEALQFECNVGATVFGPVSETTLFGRPALQKEATVTSLECNWAALDTVTQLSVPTGNILRMVAVDVGGIVVVVVSDAPSDEWASFSADVDAMLASMTLVE